MRRFYFKVWHTSYVSTITISCQNIDLSSTQALRSKLCISLFDFGLNMQNIEKVQSSKIFYVFKNKLNPVEHPMNLPNQTYLSLKENIFDEDPDIFRVQIGQNVVLPLEIDAVHMKSLSDIEFFAKRRLIRYGVKLDSTSAFFIRHAKWTLCTPTRRDFKYRIVSISPVNFDENHFIKSVCVVQRKFRQMLRHRAARVIQHRWISKRETQNEWVHLA